MVDVDNEAGVRVARQQSTSAVHHADRVDRGVHTLRHAVHLPIPPPDHRAQPTLPFPRPDPTATCCRLAVRRELGTGHLQHALPSSSGRCGSGVLAWVRRHDVLRRSDLCVLHQAGPELQRSDRRQVSAPFPVFDGVVVLMRWRRLKQDLTRAVTILEILVQRWRNASSILEIVKMLLDRTINGPPPPTVSSVTRVRGPCAHPFCRTRPMCQTRCHSQSKATFGGWASRPRVCPT